MFLDHFERDDLWGKRLSFLFLQHLTCALGSTAYTPTCHAPETWAPVEIAWFWLSSQRSGKAKWENESASTLVTNRKTEIIFKHLLNVKLVSNLCILVLISVHPQEHPWYSHFPDVETTILVGVKQLLCGLSPSLVLAFNFLLSCFLLSLQGTHRATRISLAWKRSLKVFQLDHHYYYYCYIIMSNNNNKFLFLLFC